MAMKKRMGWGLSLVGVVKNRGSVKNNLCRII